VPYVRNRKRGVTPRQIRRLAERFHVSPAVFIRTPSALYAEAMGLEPVGAISGNTTCLFRPPGYPDWESDDRSPHSLSLRFLIRPLPDCRNAGQSEIGNRKSAIHWSSYFTKTTSLYASLCSNSSAINFIIMSPEPSHRDLLPLTCQPYQI